MTAARNSMPNDRSGRYFEGEDHVRGVGPVGRVAFKADTLHDLRSCSKSIVGLLYGIALAQGKVPPPEAPLLAAFPEYADLAQGGRERLTIHHVLTMTMGTDWDESSLFYTDPRNSETAMDNAPDRYRFVLERSVVDVPGAHWTYCGGATALLARIIARARARRCRPSRARACSSHWAWVRRNGPRVATASPSPPRARACRCGIWRASAQ